MNTNQAANESMTANHAGMLPDDSLDRLLQAHLAAPAEQPAPSSGFVLSVMEAIRQEAAAPPPIAFPWRRVMPGATAILCGLAVFALLVAHEGTSGTSPNMNLNLTGPISSGLLALCGIAGAILTSIATVAVSFRLAGRSR
jgi:hypothetical protein